MKREERISWWWRVGLSAAVFSVTFGLLWAFQDAGFTRDESFYFFYGESYQEWFEGVRQAEGTEEVREAFSREKTLPIWDGNFEHPPLMKVLFGAAWKAFARKDRQVTTITETATGGISVLFEPGVAAGFEVGAKVALLAPLQQGQDVLALERVVAEGRVVGREGARAQVLLTGRGLDAGALNAGCEVDRDLAPSALPITPCQVRELRALAFMSESEAMRLPGVLSGAVATTMTFLFGELLFSWLVGLLAAGLFIFVPEHFFHGYMACFDMPIVAAQLLTLYAFWRSQDDRRWALLAGLAWGVALLTKHNAFFVPVALGLYWVLLERRALWAYVSRAKSRKLPSFPVAFWVAPLIGVAMLFAFWPRLWHAPLLSIRQWFVFHLRHEHYMQYWFGEPLEIPPFSFWYPFEKTLFTYPEVFLLLLLVGFVFLFPPWRLFTQARALFGGESSPEERVSLFVAVNGLLPILVIAVPSTPIFGGIKHWMTGAPFLALIAAYAFVRVMRRLGFPQWLRVLSAAAILLQPAHASISNSWLGTNYYNSILAGGLQGGADKQLTRIFWGHESRYALEWLNATVPYGARVYWQDTTQGSYEMYQREGWLRHDIRYHPRVEGAVVALNEPLEALWTDDLRTRHHLNSLGPTHVLSRHGVPYLYVYQRQPFQ